MTRRSVGFKLGLVTSLLHLAWVILAFTAYIQSRSSTAGLVFIPFFVLDAPIQFVLLALPDAVLQFSSISPLIVYGVFGSLLWFAIPWLTDRLMVRVFPRGSRTARGVVVAVTIPVFLVGFVFLGHLTMTLTMRQERPAELRKSLSSPASGHLRQEVVYDDTALGSVSSIDRMDCRSGGGMETVLALHRGAVFLNDRFEEQGRVVFTNGYFQTVKPVAADDGGSCRFIAYELFKHAALLDAEGRELWRSAGSGKDNVDGVECGDINGDGKPEFAVYHRYRDGIALVDESGKAMWQHPVYALGHLEMKDVRGNGKREIIFSNSNNANLATVFTTLDAGGTVVDELKVSTGSCEFEIIRWPGGEGRPNILLTEENVIRIVDMKGDTVVQLEAPGCRSFGDVEAVAVELEKGKPASLAVRKILHPDLAVLYVYDAAGKLVFQDAEVRRGSLQAAIAAVRVDEAGPETLLVGHGEESGVTVVEYSLAE